MFEISKTLLLNVCKKLKLKKTHGRIFKFNLNHNIYPFEEKKTEIFSLPFELGTQFVRELRDIDDLK